MDNWKDIAKYVLEVRRNDYEELFSDDNEEHSGRKRHDHFVDTWGFSYSDTWDLGREIAIFILPRLAYFRDHIEGVPGILVKDEDNTEKAEREWDHILKTICDGLHMYIEKDISFFTKEEQELWSKAKLYLFCYFEWLWE